MNHSVRFPAEWEPQSGVQLTFPHKNSDWAADLAQVIPCFVRIAEAISQHESLLVVCDKVAEVAPLLAHCDPARVRLVELPSNDTWARDHSGITVLEEGKPVVLDFMFNGWGLKFAADADNLLTGRLHAHGLFGEATLRRPGLVLEGGSLESDGQGTLLTTTECLLSPNRNPHLSQQEIEQELKHWLGVSRVLWLEHGSLEGDDTDAHIDTLARFCDPTTIAYVRCDQPDDPHYESFRRMEDELQAFRTADGKPYRLVPLPWPDAVYDKAGQRLPATYANFLILNEAVLLPLYNVPQDAEALRITQEIFPDHEVVGIDCSPLVLQHGSLHCVTMQYPTGVLNFK
ncbi:agmatine deiminase [Catalinimonas alkaloidigena]|uniref:Agmatine deiminase n=1 Tax=Catalinimonas alkaloidigena TaxID=1075417 RepID=A0A1G9PPW0_9BACT|nr:agmatine deiminase family protein [Catalinimonas alkaloidigena]SDM00277.1 agmatine deiminase [Catalinimonas alkaloidigena]